MSEEKSVAPALSGIDLTNIPSPEDVIAENAEMSEFDSKVISINRFPPYQPESENPNILIKGRWLERGGSAWWISTAGTGKSIATIQLAYKWGARLSFAGLTPYRPIRSWIIQSEDSPSRITIDREDIVAELSEKYPNVSWNEVAERYVHFVKLVGNVGPAFLEALNTLLDQAKKRDQMPDVIIINPFMAFIGGPVTDGGYVTPFLRGGEISGKHTDGLQMLLERHNIAALIFHHTPKPPTEKELDAWLKSTFPEYQGAGSSDITNWGRSFITMMKMKKNPRMVCLLAGKNGNEIGWDEIDGTRRKYMAWSDERGITGGRRHAWRDLTDEEYALVVGESSNEPLDDSTAIIDDMVNSLKSQAAMFTDIEARFTPCYGQRATRKAWGEIKLHADRYRLTVKQVLIGKRWVSFIGLSEGIADAVKLEQQRGRIAESFNVESSRRTPETGKAFDNE